MNSNATTVNILLVAGLGVGAFFVARNFAGDALRSVGTAVNPLSNDNLAARAADAVTRTIASDEGTSFGSFLFDLFNPTYDPNAAVAVDTPENNRNQAVRKDGDVILTPPEESAVARLARFGIF